MKISFDTNVPVQVALTSLDGEPVESQFGGSQRKYVTADHDVFYVSEAVGNIISQTCRKLQIDAGDPVVICKAEVPDGRGRKQIRWSVQRVPEQTETERAIQESIERAKARVFGADHANGANGDEPSAPLVQAIAKPQQQPVTNGNGNAPVPINGNGHAVNPQAHTGWALYLREQSATLIDVYADLCRYASERHAGVVTKDDVRSLFLSAFINVTKNGGQR